jgi:hypothetical protein
MKNYFVVWTYIANYGQQWIAAKSPKEAADKLILGFSKDFEHRATIYVFDKEPDYLRSPQKAPKPSSN